MAEFSRRCRAAGLMGVAVAAWSLMCVLLSLTACRSSSSGARPAATTSSGAAVSLGGATSPTVPPVQGQLTVFAAASLTDSFKQMSVEIERANPGTKITFNFAGSPTLRTQLAQGAHADVLATADQTNMQGAQQDGSIASTPEVFAQNRLVVIVPASGKSSPVQLQDLAKPGVKLVLAQREVPVGNYARQAFAKMNQDPAYGAGFEIKVAGNVVSEETDVKAVVAKVQLGEADAGVVYSTDVTPAVRGQVKVIAVPDQFNVIAQYPIAVVSGAANAAGAQAFVNYLLSPAGQATLRNNGFIVQGG